MRMHADRELLYGVTYGAPLALFLCMNNTEATIANASRDKASIKKNLVSRDLGIKYLPR
jgi:hypothetical protein